MPDTPTSLLAAYLWDLRAQCERQVRCLTSAQRVIDEFRQQAPPGTREIPSELRKYIAEVEEAHATIGMTLADVSRELRAVEQQSSGES